MKKKILDMRHQFMACSSEVVKLPSDTRFVLSRALFVRCVATSGPR